MPQLKAVLRKLLVREASFELDTREATDFIVFQIKHGPRKGQPVGSVAARIRMPPIFRSRSNRSNVPWGLQFTIRSKLDSGTKTELAKIVNDGFGDWFIYGHVEQEQFRHWMVIDLELFRKYHANAHYEDGDNKDGTYFRSFHLWSFPQSILVATSQTMRLAIDAGTVDAVPLAPIKDNPTEQLSALHVLIRQYGAYSKIPPQAWIEYDNAMERWKDELQGRS